MDIYWKEGNVLCGILYLKLEDFFDTAACTLCLPLEPQGILLAEVCDNDRTVHVSLHSSGKLFTALHTVWTLLLNIRRCDIFTFSVFIYLLRATRVILLLLIPLRHSDRHINCGIFLDMSEIC